MSAAAQSETVIDPRAAVDPGARLGQGVVVGPWCTVGPDVVLGDRVRLISHAVIEGRTRVGEETTVYPFATIGMAPQDLKYRGEPTRTEIGARTVIREHVTIHRGTVTGSGITRVGANCLLMAVVHVAHDCTLGDGVVVANNVVMGGHVEIGDGAVIGGAAALHQFVRIGRGAMVGGVSGVEADVIPFGMVIGNRARLSGLNVVGLRRRGASRDSIAALRRAFRDLFGGTGAFADRLAALQSVPNLDPLVNEMLAFAASPSHRGLIRAAIGADEAED
ncbi:MAG: acyl-ACP--UDP-N-acetylglucosamine O-acyltransferase [Rhodospirillales bacterium]|nr:acyl-ACP--UDP-N-acetylglucosamine O-acyltransferase [Rhodospirillales bacterium]